jgi:predicted nucleotidyltransferase
MVTKEDTIKALNCIRKAIDEDIIDVDIEQQKNKMIALTQLIGLSAECNASAKKILLKKELEVLGTIEKDVAPSKVAKMVNAECYDEGALLEYADRLNSALIHSIDAIRSVLSLYKTELENSLKQ